MTRSVKALVVISIAALLFASPLVAASYRVVPEESILSVVTHKAGIAAGVAHNHLVAASGYQAELQFDPAAPTETRLEFRAKAAALVIDSPELNQKWYSRLEKLGVLREPFEKMSAKDLEKVHRTMLGKKQLDAESFPDVTGTILAVELAEGENSGLPYRVKIAFEAHGQRVVKEIRGRFEQTPGDGSVVLEAVGDFLFTEFGIKPYSAFLGVVKNQDELTLYVRLKAVPTAGRETR